MFRATLKGLLSRKLRLTLAGLAVVLGVMFVSGSYVLTDTLKGSFDSMFTDAFSELDVSVSAEPKTVGEEHGQSTPVVPASTMEQIRTLPGVADVTGQVRLDGARIIGSNGKVVTTMGSPRFGASWAGEDSFVHLREGRGPSADSEIAINAAVAKAADVRVGDTVEVLTLQPKRSFTLVGIYGYAGGRDSMSSAHEIAFTLASAQELMLGQRDGFTSLSVDAADGVSHAQLRDTVKAAVGGDYTVRTREELKEHAEDQYSAGLGFFNNILLGFAAVALFVGTFLIINTFSIIVAQRTRELALLRAVGASQRQIITSVLVEATVIGTLASALGLAAGIGVGSFLGWIFGNITDMTTDGARIPAAAVISSFAVGIPITLLAAVLPALRAARIPPVAAMQQAATNDRPMTRLTVSGLIVTALGSALLGLGLAGDNAPMLLIGGGTLLSLTGVALLAPSLARPIAGAIGRLLAWSTPGSLGRLNARRNPRRTAITAAALMIGVALVTGMSVIVSSVNATLYEIAKNDIKVDLFVGADTAGVADVRLDPTVVDRTRNISGVASALGEYSELAEVAVGGRGPAMEHVSAYADLPMMASMWSLKPVAGTLGPLGPDQVVVDSGRAEQFQLSVGDTVSMRLAKGQPHTVTITGIYDRSGVMGGWLGGMDLVDDFQNQQLQWAFIQLDEGASESTVRAEIEALVADSPEISVSSTENLIDRASAEMDQVLTMVQVLLGLAILIALLGIINTLALSIIERTRELGMLRAIGLRRSQLMRMIAVESVIISAFGALLGVVVGSALGLAIVKALESDGITVTSLPWGDLGTYLALAGLVGVVAAIIPAIRAARINVLAAIATE
ncbi:MAG: FtsX-like permease family protein [Dactylosporangium sp.]|nr:ABC transporter permease [Dactylosporangium sp.]NNJ61486.1 FtsX-like permease family protein [Dactylosporangium sp.]